MTVEAKTYCGFWAKSLWVLKGVFAIIFLGLMAAIGANCELTCDADSPGAVASGGTFRCNGARSLPLSVLHAQYFGNSAQTVPKHVRTPDGKDKCTQCHRLLLSGLLREG